MSPDSYLHSEPYLEDPDVTIWNGDALTVLHELPDESVDCCVTSPPYWGLRDYGEEGQLGLEPTPGDYVLALCSIFEQVRRVLKPTGSLWLNLGDSYAGSWGAQSRPNGTDIKSTLEGGSMLSARQIEAHPRGTQTGSLKNTPGLKPKDLVGIPWRVAFALQEQGWWLRSDVIWAKPNPMPESITDRPTKSHEYVFLLTKSERYYFGQDDLREPYAPGSAERYQYAFGGPKAEDLVRQDAEGPGGNRTRPIGYRSLTGGAYSPPGQSAHSNARGPDGRRKTVVEGGDGSVQHRNGERWPDEAGRNIRTVWDIPTQPYPEAHFAVFPQELARRMILGGCPPGGIVLDPFGGSGTTALVARNLERKAILIELNSDYCALADKRLAQQSLLADVRPLCGERSA